MKKLLLAFVVSMLLCVSGFAQTACNALPAGTHSIALTWTQSTSIVTGNKVYCSMTSGGPYTLLQNFTTPTVAYTYASLPQNTTIFFVVTAYNASGESGNSNEASGTTLPDKPVPPVLNPPTVTQLFNPETFMPEWLKTKGLKVVTS